MMNEANRDDEARRRRRVAAHKQAAGVHDRAAKVHHDAAEFFNEHGRPAQAALERDQADHEAAKAEAERRDAVAHLEGTAADRQEPAV